MTTRKINATIGHRWSWKGGAEFEIDEEPNAEIGTKIELTLRSSAAEKFLNSQKVING